MGNKFGWHSGVLTCKDAKIQGDLYVQDDIVFSDVSAGVLGVTGGIDMQSTTSAIGIDMGGTFSTTAINIDGTCNGTSTSAILIDLDYDLLTIGSEYPKAIYADLDQTSETVAGSGGMQGIRCDTNNNAFNNLWQVSIQGRATVSDATINDAIGVYASITTSGTVAKYATTSALCAFKGDVSNSSTGSWDAQVYGIMLGYGSAVNYGGDTAIFFGYTHADVHCDYGMMLKNLSPNMSSMIYLKNEASTGAVTNAIHVDNDDTMTSVMKIDGAPEQFLNLTDCTGTNATITSDGGSAATTFKARIKVVTDDGTDAWINCYSTSNEA